ncbi:MAG: hypothetical protein Q9N68_09675 [Gammaproteobacteria bacterium]|nr:hypothetical protein [Gammaproteobacteria bacterium]
MIARLTFKQIQHAGLFSALFVSALLAISLSEFAATITITEQQSTQLGLLAAVLRLTGLLISAMLVININHNELNSGHTQLLLSTQINRSQLYFGKLLSTLLLSLTVALFSSLILLVYSQNNVLLYWGCSFFLELLLVNSMALWLAFGLRSSVLASLALLLFYLFARLADNLVQISQGPFFNPHSWLDQMALLFLTALSWLLPSLNHFALSQWLIQASTPLDHFYYSALEAVLYLLLLISATLIDLHRRVF